MTAEEIRELTIERVYQTLAAPYDESATKPSSCHDADDRSMMHGAMRVLAEQIVDALGDLLPTAVEEQLPVCTHKYVCDSSCDLQRRYVTDWRAAG